VVEQRVAHRRAVDDDDVLVDEPVLPDLSWQESRYSFAASGMRNAADATGRSPPSPSTSSLVQPVDKA
jgi:hypothetical protein